MKGLISCLVTLLCFSRNDAFGGVVSLGGRLKSIKRHLSQPHRLTALTASSENELTSSSLKSMCGMADLLPVSINGIRQRASDERHYKALTLTNGLRVLLVSDQDSSRNAAAMDVHVGSFADPADMSGLAHFCEHMIFLGSDKYPEEDGFPSYLASHSGDCNAYTDLEDTVYVSSLLSACLNIR